MGVSPLLLTIFITLSAFFSETESRSFEIVNNCTYTIWPGLQTSDAGSQLSTTGFTLKSGASFNLTVPKSWSGRVWGRTLCNESSTGNFSCLTADCGTGKVECGGNGAIPPATLAELALGTNGQDFYDVSLVDGFNLPMVVEPLGGNNCRSTGCPADLNGECPKELRVAGEVGQETVGCMGACAAFKTSQYCCTPPNDTPEKCTGTEYSDYFKKGCPQAYAYPFDENQTMYTCASANYSIVFCPGSLDETPAVAPAETPAAAPAETPAAVPAETPAAAPAETPAAVPAETPAKEPTGPEPVPSKSKNLKIIIASIASGAGIIIIILSVLAGLWSRKRKRQRG